MPDVTMAGSGRAAGAGAAPGRLELVRAFVNTLDIEAGTDELSTTAGLDRWLAVHGFAGQDRSDQAASPRQAADAALASAGSEAAEADLARARALRAGLRAVLRAHACGGPSPTGRPGESGGASGTSRVGEVGGTGGIASLGGITAGLKARLAVSEDGHVTVVPDDAGASAGLAAILIAAAEAATLGTWSRLKVCVADDCQWAFYDRSPTKSGHWCSMAVCGSRAKSRAYRQRAAVSRVRRGRMAAGGGGA